MGESIGELLDVLSDVFFLAAAIGVFLMGIQAVTVVIHRRRSSPVPTNRTGISILKPLCGLDEELEQNLESFARLPYPNFEMLLGLKETTDPAYPLAVKVAERWPDRVRVVMQEGTPGLNPKINQLITLAKAAKNDILVVSDSNVQVEENYLEEIAGYLENPKVGLVNHPVVGRGEQSFVARMESLHLSGTVGAGQVGAKVFANKTLVVGKSIAIRRDDLKALGGFETFKDILAEDYYMGQAVLALGKEVVIARSPIYNVLHHRTFREFNRRYIRWSIMQRLAVGFGVHLSQTMLTPVFLATIGLVLSPSLRGVELVAGIAVSKMAIDFMSVSLLGSRLLPIKTVLVLPVKDLCVGWALMNGFFRNTIEWRGNRRTVLEGTRLALPEGEQRSKEETVLGTAQ